MQGACRAPWRRYPHHSVEGCLTSGPNWRGVWHRCRVGGTEKKLEEHLAICPRSCRHLLLPRLRRLDLETRRDPIPFGPLVVVPIGGGQVRPFELKMIPVYPLLKPDQGHSLIPTSFAVAVILKQPVRLKDLKGQSPGLIRAGGPILSFPIAQAQATSAEVFKDVRGSSFHDAAGTASEPWNRTGQNRIYLEPAEPNRQKYKPARTGFRIRTGQNRIHRFLVPPSHLNIRYLYTEIKITQLVF